MEITASNTKDFNWKMGLALGVDVVSIFEHPIVSVSKYRVTAQPHVNIREKPDSTSKDIGDILYGTIVEITTIENGYGKLLNEPGWVSMAWLEAR